MTSQVSNSTATANITALDITTLAITTLYPVLSSRNAHPRDLNIKFQEEGHKYTILDGTSSCSSSNAQSSFCKTFLILILLLLLGIIAIFPILTRT